MNSPSGSPRPRSVWNPPNRFLPSSIEYEIDPPPADLEIFEDQSKSILSHNTSPDLGFQWSVNPYRGCAHACAYCYARPSHELLGLGAGTDFERKIHVKVRAPELLDAAFRRKNWRGELVAFSGVTDCYQPLEAQYRLTRRCLEVCVRHANPVTLITKSPLVLRDLDVLQSLHRVARLRVTVSIAFADDGTARALEPTVASIQRRYNVIRELASAGLSVGVAVSPVIPGLNDRDIPAILQKAKDCGATFAFHTMIRLPGSVEPVFLRALEDKFPERAATIVHKIREARGGAMNEAKFNERFGGKGRYWDAIESIWKLWIRRLQLEDAEDGAPMKTAERVCAPPRQLTIPFI